MCCNDYPEVMMRLTAEGCCIINHEFFANIMSEEGLHYTRAIVASRIKNQYEKRDYLAKPFDNDLKRNVAYCSFIVWINQYIPIGRHRRMMAPRCVVLKIRRLYPNDQHQYFGFKL